MKLTLDENVIVISYPNGKIIINLPEFFPSTASAIRKLYKNVIGNMVSWDDRDRITDQMITWLKARAAEAGDEDILRFYANKSVSYHTKVTEIEPDIQKQTEKMEKLKANVATLAPGEKKIYKELMDAEKDKLRKLKETKKDAFGYYRFYKNEFEKSKRKAEKLRENAALIEEIMGRK